MKISAIIPAYNEENTIKNVIETVKKCEKVDEIIVVNDGSIDRTSQISRKCGVKVVNLPENVGKGGAMKIGVKKCKGDIVLFLDADLVGLKNSHIEALLLPVMNEQAGMTVGVFSSGRFATDFAHKIASFLSGQRAMKKEIFTEIDAFTSTGYGIEAALTRYVKKQKINVQNVELEDLTHVMKEEKMGLVKGLSSRVKMYWEICKGAR